MSTGTDFGPVMRGRASLRRRRAQQGSGAVGGPEKRTRRWLVRTAVGIVMAVLVAAIGFLLYISAQIQHQQVAGLQSSRPMNILITGTDSRAELTREQQLELTTGSEGGNLTDTIFVLQAQAGETALLAFPRDLFVTRCDGTRGRINAAVQLGGPGCLVDTITQLSGLQIAHHLEVNFLGFRDIVDAAGGVELCLEAPIQDRDSGLDLNAGCQTLEGVDALGYVRVRKIDNDLERIKRQQRFVKALAGRMLSPAVLANPVRLASTATTVAESITADQRFGAIDLARSAWAMRGLAQGLDRAYTVPATDAVVGGASVLEVDDVAARLLFEQFKDGSLLATQPRATEPQVLPSDVSVAVLNGAGVEGLAGRVAQELRAKGFAVTQVGNQASVTATTIQYPNGLKGNAEVLRNSTGGNPALVRDDTLTDLVYSLGPDAAANG